MAFPLVELDLSPFSSTSEKVPLYDLTGFITHEGSGADSGHYLAYCRNEVDGNWSVCLTFFSRLFKVKQFIVKVRVRRQYVDETRLSPCVNEGGVRAFVPEETFTFRGSCSK